MAERRLPLNYRVPNTQLLEWATRIVATLGDKPPSTTEEVYAREQVILHQLQSTEIVVQRCGLARLLSPQLPMKRMPSPG